MSHQPTGHTPGPTPDRRALAEAYRDLIKEEAERQATEAAPPPRPRPSVKPFLAVLLVGAAAYLWLASPVWLKSETPSEPRVVREASLRLAMYVLAQRIEQFRLTNQRLPTALAELGHNGEGIAYQPFDSTSYELRGRQGEINLTWNSTEPLATFVGNSVQLLTPQERSQ